MVMPVAAPRLERSIFAAKAFKFGFQILILFSHCVLSGGVPFLDG
jgi:hypothetical protein